MDMSSAWAAYLYKEDLRRSSNLRETARRVRADQMIEQYRLGATLADIGRRYGITRERVRQILGSVGITKIDSARPMIRAAKAIADAHEKRLKKEAAIFERFGCSSAELERINGAPWTWRNTTKYPAAAFLTQRHNARRRGVEWRMTLSEWWEVWSASGKYHLRGRGSGYCMARYGDSGPYSADNVYICTIGQNFSDRYLTKPKISHLYCKYGHPMFGQHLRICKGRRWCPECKHEYDAKKRRGNR